MIEAVRRTFSITGIGREVAHWRVMVGLALSRFFLHYAHGRPFFVEFSPAKLTGLTAGYIFEDSTDDNSIFPYVNDWHFNAQRGQHRADLTPVITPVIERLGQTNRYGRTPLISILFVFFNHLVRSQILRQERRPHGAQLFHRAT
jgi:hypothetical protein